MSIDTSVDAWVYTSAYPQGLKQGKVTVPKKEEQKEDQIIIQVNACALNPVDIQTMNLPRKNENDKGKEWGIVNDFSGRVIQAKGFSEGDEVFGMSMSAFTPLRTGTLAKVAVLDEKSTSLIKKPNEWTHEQASSLPLVWLTAKACIEDVKPFVSKSNVKEKRIVVLGGSSAVGIYTIILAKKLGWKVLSTSSSRNKEFLQNKLQVDQHVDYTKDDVRAQASAFKPQAVIDCVGGTDCIGIKGNLRYISIVGDKTGRGAMGGPYTYYDWSAPIFAIRQWVRWARGYIGLGESYDIIHLSLEREWLEEVTKTLTTDSIYIDSVFPFEKAKEAFQRLDTGRAQGKVIVRVQ